MSKLNNFRDASPAVSGQFIVNTCPDEAEYSPPPKTNCYVTSMSYQVYCVSTGYICIFIISLK